MSTKASSRTPTPVETPSSFTGKTNLELPVSIIPIPGHGKVFGRLVEQSNTSEHLRQIKDSAVLSLGREKRLRVEPTDTLKEDDSDEGDFESPVWSSYASTDIVINSPHKDIPIPSKVLVLKKSDILLLRNNGYRVFDAKSIIPDINRKFLGTQSL